METSQARPTRDVGAADLVYDPRDPSVMADPFPLYRRLREEDPAHWSPSLKSWVVTRYEDVRDLLLSDRLSVNRLMGFYRTLPTEDAERLREIVGYLNLWIAFRDPPDHTRMRRIIRHAFTASAVEEMRAEIDDLADLLLDALEARGAETDGRVDLIADFAAPLPAYVIMDLLGVPRDMFGDFKRWSEDLAVFIGGARNAADKYDRAARGCRGMAGYFRALIEERRRAPAPGFLMDLINARDEDEALSDDELVATCILVLFAGHETTTNLIGNAALCLLQAPDALERFKASPDVAASAIEEVLRYDGPTNALVREVAVAQELHGKTLREGDRVFAMVNAANRDPRAFEAPERFDIDRRPNRHLTFGQGVHICLGAKLAREEGRIAVGRLFERFPRLALDRQRARVWRDAMVPRGMSRFPVVLDGG